MGFLVYIYIYQTEIGTSMELKDLALSSTKESGYKSAYGEDEPFFCYYEASTPPEMFLNEHPITDMTATSSNLTIKQGDHLLIYIKGSPITGGYPIIGGWNDANGDPSISIGLRYLENTSLVNTTRQLGGNQFSLGSMSILSAEVDCTVIGFYTNRNWLNCPIKVESYLVMQINKQDQAKYYTQDFKDITFPSYNRFLSESKAGWVTGDNLSAIGDYLQGTRKVAGDVHPSNDNGSGIPSGTYFRLEHILDEVNSHTSLTIVEDVSSSDKNHVTNFEQTLPSYHQSFFLQNRISNGKGRDTHASGLFKSMFFHNRTAGVVATNYILEASTPYHNPEVSGTSNTFYKNAMTYTAKVHGLYGNGNTLGNPIPFTAQSGVGVVLIVNEIDAPTGTGVALRNKVTKEVYGYKMKVSGPNNTFRYSGNNSLIFVNDTSDFQNLELITHGNWGTKNIGKIDFSLIIFQKLG
jgi:hypothetical protein